MNASSALVDKSEEMSLLQLKRHNKIKGFFMACELAQWQRALVLIKDHNLIPSIHMDAPHSHKLQACMWQGHPYRQSSHKHKLE